MIEFLEGLLIFSGAIFLFDAGLMFVTRGDEGLLLYLIKKGIVRIKKICKGSSYPRIPFKTFEHLYYINPDKWYISDKDCVRYCKETESSYSYERFDFTLLDYFKYQSFLRTIDKQGEKKLRLAQEEAKQKKLEECTKLWIKDIEVFVAENEKRMRTAKIENEEIIKRILGERA